MAVLMWGCRDTLSLQLQEDGDEEFNNQTEKQNKTENEEEDEVKL